jgi:hypothetical protein
MTNFYELEQKIEISLFQSSDSLEPEEIFLFDLKKGMKRVDESRITNICPQVT